MSTRCPFSLGSGPPFLKEYVGPRPKFTTLANERICIRTAFFGHAFASVWSRGEGPKRSAARHTNTPFDSSCVWRIRYSPAIPQITTVASGRVSQLAAPILRQGLRRHGGVGRALRSGPFITQSTLNDGPNLLMDETFRTFPYHICANDGRVVMRGERIICTAVSDVDAKLRWPRTA